MEFCVPETTYKVQETSASNQCLDDTHSTPGYSTMTLETNESLTSDYKLFTEESDNTAKINPSQVSTDYRHMDTPTDSAAYSGDDAKSKKQIQSPSALPTLTLPASQGDTMQQSGVKHKQPESWPLWNMHRVRQDSKGVFYLILLWNSV